MNPIRLPASIQALIFKGSSGRWIVELPKYDMVAQVDSEAEVDNMVTSLVFTHFNLSDKFKTKVRYVLRDPAMKIKESKSKALPFQKFVASRFTLSL